MNKFKFETLTNLFKELLHWRTISCPDDGFYLDEIELRVFKIREELSAISQCHGLNNEFLPSLLAYRTLTVEDMSSKLVLRLDRKIKALEHSLKALTQTVNQNTLNSSYFAITDLYKTFKEIADG